MSTIEQIDERLDAARRQDREQERLHQAHGYAKLTEHAYRVAAVWSKTVKLTSLAETVWRAPATNFGPWRCYFETSGPLQYLKCRHKDGRVAVVVTGTNQLKDIPVNADLRLVEVPGLPGKWHQGYIDLAVELDVAIETDAFFKGEDDIVFVGHSLGATVAMGAAAMMPLRVAEIVALDPPRLGDEEAMAWFSLTFQGRYMRWTRGASIVAWWPFKWMGYRHPEPVRSISRGTAKAGAVDFWAMLWAVLGRPGVQTIEHHRVGSLADGMAEALDGMGHSE